MTFDRKTVETSALIVIALIIGFCLLGIVALVIFNGGEESMPATTTPTSGVTPVSPTESTIMPKVDPAPTPSPLIEAIPTPEADPIPEEAPAAKPELAPEAEPTSPPTPPTEGVYIDPPSQEVKPGQEISVRVKVKFIGCGVSGSEIKLEFDPTVLQVTDLIAGDLLGSNPLVGIEAEDNQLGILHYVLARKGPTQIATSSGVLAMIEFKVMESARSGSHNLTLAEIELTNEEFEGITGFEIQHGTVEVR